MYDDRILFCIYSLQYECHLNPILPNKPDGATAVHLFPPPEILLVTGRFAQQLSKSGHPLTGICPV